MSLSVSVEFEHCIPCSLPHFCVLYFYLCVFLFCVLIFLCCTQCTILIIIIIIETSWSLCVFCGEVYCGDQGRCKRLKVVPSCSQEGTSSHTFAVKC